MRRSSETYSTETVTRTAFWFGGTETRSTGTRFG